MQAKIFKRERDRLLGDEKQILTSKGLIQNAGVKLPTSRPADENTDMKMLKADEDRITEQVKLLNQLASTL